MRFIEEKRFDLGAFQDILVPQLLAFLADHPELTFLGLVLTDACKDPVFR